ncbi:MAG: methyltransferase domain-containing protein [Alphaproteobacteria bacterium]|nr:methyltransferase domain-containing protein [Alphaproteobacteria bacterium]MCB9928449.1 methyltransferase domain-containing protein [Alphaproteobacteria bacterium]
MTAPEIFDRRLVRARRERAAAGFGDHSFLYDEVCARLIERLALIQRGFPRALVLGARTGGLADGMRDGFGVETLVQADLSGAMLARADGPRLVVDEEWLPFADASLDLVVSPLSLHVVNDLPGALAQIRRALKPDGLFLGALFGLGTLAPLRDALLAAEAGQGVGSSPHVAPFTEVRVAGSLLQRAGFALPVADAETVTVTYRNPMRLFADLRGMGETNVLSDRTRQGLRRGVLMEAAARLAGQAIPFEVVFLAGWAPAAGQQKPLAPGSGQVSLARVLK